MTTGFSIISVCFSYTLLEHMHTRMYIRTLGLRQHPASHSNNSCTEVVKRCELLQ